MTRYGAQRRQAGFSLYLRCERSPSCLLRASLRRESGRLVGQTDRWPCVEADTPSKMPSLAVGRPGQNRELFESSLRSIVAGRSWP